jgi:nucleotide-binding universal stress UspA family protein
MLKKILVTTDLSKYSAAAIEYASSLALLYDARIYLLHVEDVTPPVMYTVHVPDFDAEHFHLDALAEGRKRLEQFVQDEVRPLITPLHLKLKPVLRLGKPVDEIRRFVQEEGIDLVVMATHGRTGLRHIMIGSIAERVIRVSPVPVLTVKPFSQDEELVSRTDVEYELHLK